MIFKTLLSLLIVFIVYALIVLNFPSLANSIAWYLWIEWINEKIIEYKADFDLKSTNINSWADILSWAIDLKDNIIDSVDKTKEKIDSIRNTMSWVESTYNDLKDWYDSIQNFIDDNSGTLDSIKWTVDDINNIRDSLTNTWTVTN